MFDISRIFRLFNAEYSDISKIEPMNTEFIQEKSFHFTLHTLSFCHDLAQHQEYTLSQKLLEQLQHIQTTVQEALAARRPSERWMRRMKAVKLLRETTGYLTDTPHAAGLLDEGKAFMEMLNFEG